MDAKQFGSTHIGWVPCVIGRLYFCHTSCGLHDGHPIAQVNYLEQHDGTYSRRIIISSKVNWRDHHQEGGRDEGSLTGIYRAILTTCFEDDSESIVGKVYIASESFAHKSMGETDSEIKVINDLVEDADDIKDNYSNLLKLTNSIDDTNLYKVSFLLNRRGFVYLKLEGGTYDYQTRETIIRQAYYYIKYSWHKHQHHNGTAESLTTAHLYQDGCPSVGINLIDDLKSALVMLKRDFAIVDYQNLLHAKGIAGYTKSLINSCSQEGLIDQAECKKQEDYLCNVSDSLQVMSEAVKRDADLRSLISSNFKALLLFALSVIAPITIVFRQDIRDMIKIDEASNIVMVDLISKVLGSNVNLAIVASFLSALFLLYRAICLRFNSSFIAYQWFRDSIDKIVKEKNKASILAITMIGFSILLLMWSMGKILLST